MCSTVTRDSYLAATILMCCRTCRAVTSTACSLDRSSFMVLNLLAHVCAFPGTVGSGGATIAVLGRTVDNAQL